MKKPQDEDAAEAETREMLVDCRALLSDDHFIYISGDHGSGWVDNPQFTIRNRLGRPIRAEN